MRSSFLHLAVLLAALTGCHRDLFSKAADEPEAGVPLTLFQAKDGQYFPNFIAKFFPNAERYQKDYPTLAQARSDVTMIEIKQLNSSDVKFNEANLSWSADGVYLGYEVLVDGTQIDPTSVKLAGRKLDGKELKTWFDRRSAGYSHVRCT